MANYPWPKAMREMLLDDQVVLKRKICAPGRRRYRLTAQEAKIAEEAGG